jgi:hypothetical protein
LTLKYDEALSKIAFEFNSRHYTEVAGLIETERVNAAASASANAAAAANASASVNTGAASAAAAAAASELAARLSAAVNTGAGTSWLGRTVQVGPRFDPGLTAGRPQV